MHTQDKRVKNTLNVKKKKKVREKVMIFIVFSALKQKVLFPA